MKNRRNTIKYLVCALVLMYSVSPELQAQTFPEKVIIPDNMGVQLKSGNVADLDKIQELGLKWVRRRFSWEGVETVKGQYNFADYDKFVADCEERGLSIIGCMAFSHEKFYGHVKDEPARTGYANFAAACAERYKGKNIIWEIWNEPNTMTFWGKHGGVGNSPQYAQEYSNLVKATVRAMKKANPDCVIAAGSVSNLWSESYKWMGYCFGLEGLLRSDWDIWSVHPYGLKGPEDYIDAYAYSRGLMVQADDGPTDRLWINSERGFSIGKGEGWVDGEANMAFQYQAWHLVRQYLIDLLEGMPVTIWYEWSGSEGFALYNTRSNHPAFMACQELVRQLSGYYLDQRIVVEEGQDFILQFKSPGGNTKLVAWAAPPKNQSQDNITPHTISLEVSTNKTHVKQATIYGEISELPVTDGKINIYLTGSPVYIDLENGTAPSRVPAQTETYVNIFSEAGSNLLNVSASRNMAGTVTIHDLPGKVVYQHTGALNELTIDMNGFADGVHIVNIYDENNHPIKTQKIVK